MDAGLLRDKAAMFREMTKERPCNIQSFSATKIVITFIYFPVGLGLTYLKRRVLHIIHFRFKT